jgi:phosphonate degradation associated HDIG domain protein
MQDPFPPIDVIACLRRHAALQYEGEGVTQLQHAWQCARLAHRAGASDALQLAAWLHDLGHLLTGLEGSPTLRGIDDRHEALGAAVLRAQFGEAVSEPVALHVAAKRCLVATRAGYAQSLSADSVRSLALQGGPMDDAECAAFLQRPASRDAMRLRVWDDLAKQPDWCFASEDDALIELTALAERVRAARSDA